MHIRPLVEADLPAVEIILDRAFGPGRRTRTASLLRAGSRRLWPLCFAAEADGRLLGAVQCWAIAFLPRGGQARPLVLLGPLAVLPELRGQGIGIALMEAATEALDRLGLPAMLIGDAPYYGRFGFSAAATGQWRLPGPVEPGRLLLRAAEPEAFAGPARLLPSAGLEPAGPPAYLEAHGAR